MLRVKETLNPPPSEHWNVGDLEISWKYCIDVTLQTVIFLLFYKVYTNVCEFLFVIKYDWINICF